MLKVQHIIARLNRWLCAFCNGLLLLLVALVVYNVISRYALRASSLALEELAWHLYATIFLLGIPYALHSNTHVRVDFVYEKLKPKTQAIINIIGCLVFLIPSCVVIIWAGWEFTAVSYTLGQHPDSLMAFVQQLFTDGIGERSQDPGGLANRWIIKGVIPLAFLLLLCNALALLLEQLRLFFSHSR